MHVLYGGAHLFSAQAPTKIATRARESLAQSNPKDFGRALGIEGELAEQVFAKVERKLAGRAVEAMCIDFEDGYGPRSDAEEDETAERVANDLAALGTDVVIGIRIKGVNERGLRTLAKFRHTPPPGFTVTLPKVRSAHEVETLLGSTPHPIELMIETPEAMENVRSLLVSDRVRAIHLGAYDLGAELGVLEGRLDHPFCDHARTQMQVAVVNRDVAVYDGATTLMPIGSYAEIHRAWALHAANVARAIDFGIWSGWDLHPAQLPARYGALYAYFLARKAKLEERLARFEEKKAQASRVGQAFDDAATARGLVEFFRRARELGVFE